MVADVVFHELAHQAIDGASGGRQSLQDVGALLIVIERAQDGFQLPDDFFGAIDEVQFFPCSM